MKSIKQKMIIGVLLICVVGIGINTAVAYDIARTMIYEEAVDGKQKFVNAESADIDGWIAENKAVLDTLARTFETLPSDTRDRDALRRLFAFQTQGHGQIKDIYAGFSDDMSVFGLSTTDRSSYYPTTRPWYIQAMEHKGQIIVTGPYESATTTGTLVTIARYAGQQDGYDCVLGLDIYISAIADAVTDMALADGAYVYIAGVNGEIIAESAASARGVRDGVKREVFIGDIPSTRWTYVYAVPEKVITAPVHKLLAGVLLILSVVVFVVCVFAWQFITRIIVAPLRAVSSASDKIADGIIDFPLQSNSRDEIGALIRDFARVQETIRSLIKGINGMSLAQKAGDLEARIDDSVFVGAYKEVADGVNGMTGELVELIDKTRSCLDGFANGDLDAPFPSLPGKQARLTQSIESFRKNLFYREVE